MSNEASNRSTSQFLSSNPTAQRIANKIPTTPKRINKKRNIIFHVFREPTIRTQLTC
uniref:Uncharacterized protein n=1 Tax=Arundo donax TaxID=35708 RepID=A0A0A9UC18_ARUDO